MQHRFNHIGLFGILVMVSVIVTFPIAYSEQIKCAENIDYTKYPICKYQNEWNESESFNMKVSEEMAIHSDQINENPDLFLMIYQQSIDTVDKENPGLLQQTLDMKAWIYAQLDT